MRLLLIAVNLALSVASVIALRRWHLRRTGRDPGWRESPVAYLATLTAMDATGAFYCYLLAVVLAALRSGFPSQGGGPLSPLPAAELVLGIGEAAALAAGLVLLRRAGRHQVQVGTADAGRQEVAAQEGDRTCVPP